MKITKENALEEYPKVREGMPEAIEETFEKLPKLLKFYGRNDGITEVVDIWLEKVNAALAKREPKAEPKAEPEPKKDEPKAEKPKAEPKPKAEKPKKEKPKAEPKFKVGDWIADQDGRPVKIRRIIEENGGYAYVYMYKDNTEWVISEDKAKKLEPSKITSEPTPKKPKKEPKAKAEKQPKEKKAKEKKEPEGEPVAKVSPEITIIKRFVKFGHSKKATANNARLILVALQKMIVNKEIRKTSQYADDIMDIQKALLSIMKNGKVEFDRSKFERYEKLADTEYQEPIAKLSRSFIGLIGKVGVKDKAKNLLEKFEKAEASGDLVDTMKKALKAYIDGKTTTVETEERSLQGIYGLAGI